MSPLTRNDSTVHYASQSVIIALTLTTSLTADDAARFGKLIFQDSFERTESQEKKDEPGNEWTTSSDKTAGGNKQVDLRDGTMYIYTHATANHATSVRHTFRFTDGTLALRFKLHEEGDSLKLNFTDLGCKTVHAGHLFDAVVSRGEVLFEDRKTGVMNLKTRAASKSGTLTEEQRKALWKKKKTSPAKIEIGKWHQIAVHVDGERISADIDGKSVGSFDSEGIAHPTKTMIRLLVPKTATVDDVRIWRRK